MEDAVTVAVPLSAEAEAQSLTQPPPAMYGLLEELEDDLRAGERSDRRRLGRPSRGALRLSLVCILLLLGLLAAPASAQATFSFVGTLSAPEQHAAEPQVAMAPDGDAVFVWSRFDGSNFRVQARARSASGTLGPILTLSAAGQSAIEPQVAVDPAGNATFVWARFDGSTQCGAFGASCLRIQTRTLSAAGALGTTRTISPAAFSGSGPQVGVDASGNAVFGWLSIDGDPFTCGGFSCKRILARALPAGGTLSTVQTVGGPVTSISEPQLGADADGDAVFVWTRGAGTGCGNPDSPCGVVEARARSAAGMLSAKQTLSSGPLILERPEVAVDPGGDAVFVWSFAEVGTNCGGGASCVQIRTRARTAAGMLSGVQGLSASNRKAALPEVGVDSLGNAVFTWRIDDGSTQCDFGTSCERIQARARTAGGTLSPRQFLSGAGEDAGDPELGVDSDGDSVFVWTRPDASTDCGGQCLRVQARSRSSTGALSAVQTVSPPGQPASDPQIAVAPNGAAAATWKRSDGSRDRIQAAVQPPPS